MIDGDSRQDTIGTIDVPDCYLCGSAGVTLYERLSDQWFETLGSWDLKHCPNPECGLVWLDPMPSKEDVGKAYRSYFTHRDYTREETRKPNSLDIFLMKALKPLYKLFMRATGCRRREKEWRTKIDSLFLDDVLPSGRLLDVGCGKGDFLARMSLRGWAVEGLEVDAEAVEFARSNHSLTVHLGALENLRFPDGSFDAITANHVIEHVHEPDALIRECLRVLAPGGRLVLATPNIDSIGHRRFGRNWSHLDPPRHLHLFTKKTLKGCVAKAGFQSINVWCAPGYAEGGALLVSSERTDRIAGRERGEFIRWLDVSLLKIWAYYRFFAKKEDEVGEEMFLMARKEA